MDYKINDTVLYGAGGVCSISEVAERKIGLDTDKYYILRPISDEKSTIFVPISNEKLLSKMRRVHSSDEVISAFERAADSKPEWIVNENERKGKFKKDIDNGDIYEVLCFFKSLYLHQKERISQGKKLRVNDERMMKDAERLLSDELSYVLEMKKEGFGAFIVDRLKIK